MPYGITQCYLPPGSSDFPTFTSVEATARFSDPGGMQGWVDLGGGYNSQDSYPAKDGHLSQNYWPGSVMTGRRTLDRESWVRHPNH